MQYTDGFDSKLTVKMIWNWIWSEITKTFDSHNQEYGITW